MATDEAIHVGAVEPNGKRKSPPVDSGSETTRNVRPKHETPDMEQQLLYFQMRTLSYVPTDTDFFRETVREVLERWSGLPADLSKALQDNGASEATLAAAEVIFQVVTRKKKIAKYMKTIAAKLTTPEDVTDAVVSLFRAVQEDKPGLMTPQVTARLRDVFDQYLAQEDGNLIKENKNLTETGARATLVSREEPISSVAGDDSESAMMSTSGKNGAEDVAHHHQPPVSAEKMAEELVGKPETENTNINEEFLKAKQVPSGAAENAELSHTASAEVEHHEPEPEKGVRTYVVEKSALASVTTPGEAEISRVDITNGSDVNVGPQKARQVTMVEQTSTNNSRDTKTREALATPHSSETVQKGTGVEGAFPRVNPEASSLHTGTGMNTESRTDMPADTSAKEHLVKTEEDSESLFINDRQTTTPQWPVIGQAHLEKATPQHDKSPKIAQVSTEVRREPFKDKNTTAERQGLALAAAPTGPAMRTYPRVDTAQAVEAQRTPVGTPLSALPLSARTSKPVAVSTPTAPRPSELGCWYHNFNKLGCRLGKSCKQLHTKTAWVAGRMKGHPPTYMGPETFEQPQQQYHPRDSQQDHRQDYREDHRDSYRPGYYEERYENYEYQQSREDPNESRTTMVARPEDKSSDTPIIDLLWGNFPISKNNKHKVANVILANIKHRANPNDFITTCQRKGKVSDYSLADNSSGLGLKLQSALASAQSPSGGFNHFRARNSLEQILGAFVNANKDKFPELPEYAFVQEDYSIRGAAAAQNFAGSPMSKRPGR